MLNNFLFFRLTNWWKTRVYVTSWYVLCSIYNRIYVFIPETKLKKQTNCHKFYGIKFFDFGFACEKIFTLTNQ